MTGIKYSATHEIYSRFTGELQYLYDSTKDAVLSTGGDYYCKMGTDFTKMVAGGIKNTSGYIFKEINICLENK